MSGMKELLDRIFKLEEINGNDRWTILKLWAGRRVYLHHFIGEPLDFWTLVIVIKVTTRAKDVGELSLDEDGY